MKSSLPEDNSHTRSNLALNKAINIAEKAIARGNFVLAAKICGSVYGFVQTSADFHRLSVMQGKAISAMWHNWPSKTPAP